MKTLPTPNTTARELLELVAGNEHALHSVSRYKQKNETLTLECSCGEKFKLPRSAIALTALRNVPEGL